MALSTVTRQQLRQLVGGVIGVRGLVTGTATDDSTTTVQSGTQLVDARNGLGLKDTAWPRERFANAWLGAWAGATVTAYESARILDYQPTTGAVVVGRTFATTPVTALTGYEVWPSGVSPAEVNEAIKWACRSAMRPVDWTLTGLLEHNDGGMEESGTTSWTGSNATLAKVTSEAVTGRGVQALSVANTGANGYAGSVTLAVMEVRNYRVFGLCRTTTGVGSIVVRDVTNGANVTVTWSNLATVDGTQEGDWRLLIGAFTTPAACVGVSLRLTNTSATGQSYWDDVGLYACDDGFLDLPTWLTDPESDLVDVRVMVPTFSARESVSYERLRPLRRPVGTPTGSTAWKLPVPIGLSFPVSISAAREFTELAADTDTIPTEYQDYLATGAVYRLMVAGAQPRGMDAREFGAERERNRLLWEDFCQQYHPVYRHGRPVWSDGGPGGGSFAVRRVR